MSEYNQILKQLNNLAPVKLLTEVAVAVKKAELPVPYQEMIRAIVACQNIDEAKYFRDKSEALVAYAKMYCTTGAQAEAARTRLHSYRRMGQLAAELRPGGFRNSGKRGGVETLPGPNSLLIEQGLSSEASKNATALGRIQEEKFARVVALPRPPTPGGARSRFGLWTGHRSKRSSDAWASLMGLSSGTTAARSFLSTVIGKYSAKDLARGLNPDEVEKAREFARKITDWLDEFEQYLPKQDTKKRAAR